MNRTFNTLFMLISVDGKISTGKVNQRDVDKDFKIINGIKEGLNQYYELEKKTDEYSLNTGKVMAKIGVNTDENPIHCPEVNFIIIDNNHLSKQGILNLVSNLKKLFLVTKNPKHPAFTVNDERLEIILYDNEIDFANLFIKLKEDYQVDSITIQSGGTLNSLLIRSGLIDKLSLVVAPALIGGEQTPTLMDGKTLIEETELFLIKTLKLVDVKLLNNSYLHIIYEINN